MSLPNTAFRSSSHKHVASPIRGTDDDFRIYIAHSKIFMNDGKGPLPGQVVLPYLGAVSYMSSSENFKKLHTVISGLPVSDHDHAPNQLKFSNDGTLYMAVGGQTNAGSPHIFLGGLQESPLSGAVLKAKIKAPGFDGFIKYGFIPDSPAMSVPRINAMD